MSWATRMRLYYAGGVLTFLGIVIGLPLYFLVHTTPTCFDGKVNGDEQGIDCGGSCERLCRADISAPTLLWSRAFKVTDSVYNAVAYVENTNHNSLTRELAYRFTFFDADNILIAERKGTTFLTPNSVAPIFEGGVLVGNRVPVRTFFEITNEPTWYAADGETAKLVIVDEVLHDIDSSPRLTARIKNDSIVDARNVEIVVVLFGVDGNAVAVSETVLDRLNKKTEEELSFTWPQAFEMSVGRIEITPRLAE